MEWIRFLISVVDQLELHLKVIKLLLMPGYTCTVIQKLSALLAVHAPCCVFSQNTVTFPGIPSDQLTNEQWTKLANYILQCKDICTFVTFLPWRPLSDIYLRTANLVLVQKPIFKHKGWMTGSTKCNGIPKGNHWQSYSKKKGQKIYVPRDGDIWNCSFIWI